MNETPTVRLRQRPVPRQSQASATLGTRQLATRPAKSDESKGDGPVLRMRTRPVVESASLPEAVATSSGKRQPARTLAGNDENLPRGRAIRESYAVGYKRPPREHQFRPGNNANPRGRPKGSKNLSTLLKEALDEKVMVRENGKSRRMSKGHVISTRLVNKLVETSDPRLLQALLRLLPPVSSQTSLEMAPDPRGQASTEKMIEFLETVLRDGGSLLASPSQENSD